QSRLQRRTEFLLRARPPLVAVGLSLSCSCLFRTSALAENSAQTLRLWPPDSCQALSAAYAGGCLHARRWDLARALLQSGGDWFYWVESSSEKTTQTDIDILVASLTSAHALARAVHHSRKSACVTDVARSFFTGRVRKLIFSAIVRAENRYESQSHINF